MKDTSIDGAIRKALGRRDGRAEGKCPDENVLAAYLEARLTEAEREDLEKHASDCTSCQQIIGLALMIPDAEAQPPAGDAVASPGKKILFHFSLPVSAFAALVLAVVAGVLLYRVVRESARFPAVSTTAEMRAPAKAEGISAARAPEAILPKEEPAQGRKLSMTSVEKAKRSGLKREIPAGSSQEPAGDKDIAHESAEDKPAFQAAASVGIVGGRTASEQPIPPPAAIDAGAPPATRLVETKGIRADGKSGVTAIAEDYKRADNLNASRAELSGAKVAATPQVAPALQPIALAPAVTPREAVANFAALTPSEHGKPVEKKTGDRTFYLNSGYWIDTQCAGHVSADYEEIRTGSTEYEQILKAMPGLARTRPAIVYWSGKNAVLR